jgi:phospholipid/cholesterol/gamma-HCH transport system substrate-binding protein
MSPGTIGRSRFEWAQVRVAGLSILAVLVLVYAVYRVGGVFDVFAARYEIVMTLPSALGLREGAPVTLAGQRIGQVSRISFIPPAQKRGEENLIVRLAISEEVREQIRTDSRAFLRTEGLLGDRFVDIRPGTPGARVLAPGDTLLTGESVDLDEFMAQAATAMDSALLVISSVRQIAEGVAEGQGTLGRLLVDDRLYVELVTTATEARTTIASVRGTLDRFGRADGTFGRLMTDPALYDELTRAVARVDSIGAMAIHGGGTIGRLLTDDALHTSLLGTVGRADVAMAEITEFLVNLTRGDGTVQRLFTDPALYDELLKAIIDVQTLINAIRVDPERFRPDIRVRVF